MSKLEKPTQAGRSGSSLYPNALGGQSGWITRSRDRDHPGQHGETSYLLQKISPVWWSPSVVQAPQVAEAGEWFEPGRQNGSKPRWRHYTPAWATERDSISKKQLSQDPTYTATPSDIGAGRSSILMAVCQLKMGGFKVTKEKEKKR